MSERYIRRVYYVLFPFLGVVGRGVVWLTFYHHYRYKDEKILMIDIKDQDRMHSSSPPQRKMYNYGKAKSSLSIVVGTTCNRIIFII
jgi:hypothetical protein